MNEWVAISVSSDVKDFNEQTDRSDYNIDYDKCPKQAEIALLRTGINPKFLK